MTVTEADNAYLAHTYNRFPVVLAKGKGAILTDENGKDYIDLAAGIAVNGLGCADEGWVQAVTGQLGKLAHTSNLYYSEPGARLGEMLCKRTGMKKVFLCNSGAEANECAIKAARAWGSRNAGTTDIITLCNSFHGRTLTTLAATGQDVFHKDFLPLTEGFRYAPANDLAALEKRLQEAPCAAVLFELVQGEGGVIPLEKEYVQGLVALSRKHGFLLAADEVQTGNGRTGTLYAYQQYGFQPDILTTAKGLGNGLPIGACLLGEKTENIFTSGSHGSTFGGNPVCCAGALYVLGQLDEAFLASVREKSALIFNTLAGAKGIRSVTGLGLMIGVETEKDAGEVISTCLQKGVLVIRAKDKVRLLPPLNIEPAILKKALCILKEACAE